MSVVRLCQWFVCVIVELKKGYFLSGDAVLVVVLCGSYAG